MKHSTIMLVKFKSLMRRTRLPMWQAIGVLESLWLFALHNARNGDLSRFAADELAAWMDFQGDANELIENLVATRWLDRDADGLRIHDWDDHKPNWLKAVDARQQSPELSAKPGVALSPQPGSQPSLAPGSAQCAEPGSATTKPNPTQPNETHSSPTSTSSSQTVANPFDVEAEVVDFISKLRNARTIVAPAKLESAIRAALAAGCSIAQLRDRATWFSAHRENWPDEHQPGALFVGLNEAAPGMPVDVGWPHANRHVMRERRRENGEVRVGFGN